MNKNLDQRVPEPGMNFKRTGGRILLFAALLFSARAQAQFSGDYAPANWMFSIVAPSSGGSLDVSGAPGSIAITSGNANVAGDAIYSVTVPNGGTITFDWSYSTTDGAPFDYPLYAINGVVYSLTTYSVSGSKAQSGTQGVQVASGDIFALIMHTTDGQFNPGITVFSNFQTPHPPTATISSSVGHCLTSVDSLHVDFETYGDVLGNWSWFLDGNPVAGSDNLTDIAATSVGTYHVEFSTNISNYVGNSYNMVLPAMVSTSVTGATSFCDGGSVELNLSQASIDANDAATTYEWFNQTASVGTGLNYVATTPGSYSVQATFEGCATISAKEKVRVYAIPDATVTSSGVLCTGVMLAAPSGTGYQYSWSNASGVVGIKRQFKVVSPGDYTVAVTKNGCGSISPVTTIKQTPAKPVILGSAGECANLSTTLSTDGVYESYIWTKASVNIGMASTQEVNTTGTYNVTVNDNGCPVTSAAFHYGAYAVPQATITAAGGSTDLTAGTVKLTASSGAGVIYDWTMDGTSIGLNTRSIIVNNPGSYNVIVTNLHCSNASAPTIVTGGAGRHGVAAIAAPEELADNATVYPNPSTGVYTIQSAGTVNATVRDMQGRTVLNVLHATQIDISGYANGLYLLQLSGQDGSIISSVRLIKQ